jgi:nucleoside-diphosphate-sugar epimerase
MKRRASPFRHRRPLVIGASGFIGHWVARALRAQGAHVMCAVRSVEAAEALTREQVGTVIVRRDLRDLAALSDWLPALRPTMVFNLAGYGVDRSERDADEADLLNHRFVEALAHAVAAVPHDDWAGVRLVHVGSALEYGTTGGVLDESSACAPTTLYGRTKLAGTLALQRVSRSLALEACTARLFTVFGPGEHAGRLLPSLLAAADGSAPVPLSAGTQRRDFAYVEDVAEGLLRLAVSDVHAGDIVNLGTGVLHTVRHFAESAGDVLGIPRERLDFGAVETRPDEMAHEGVSVQLLRTLTRWTPDDDIASGVARTMVRLSEPAVGGAPAGDGGGGGTSRGGRGGTSGGRATTPAGTRAAPATGKRRGPPAA